MEKKENSVKDRQLLFIDIESNKPRCGLEKAQISMHITAITIKRGVVVMCPTQVVLSSFRAPLPII